MYFRFIAILLIIASTSSCAKRYSPLDVSQFILEKDLVVQVGHQQAYFQSGDITAGLYLNPYNPYCEIKTDRISSDIDVVKIDADVFSVANKYEDSSFGQSYSNSSGQKVGTTYVTEFLLSSKNQGHVLSLNCFRWVASSNKRVLNMSEIEKIIGSAGRFVQ